MSSDIPNASGIYRITCTSNGKIYIGSSIDLYQRWKEHRSELRRNRHHSITLQRAWNKYGEDAFAFEVMELVLPMFLIEREQYWLDKFKPFDPRKGYNIAQLAQSRLGLKASPETRARISMAGKGRITSPETREKLRIANLGKKQSPEHIEKRRIARIGFKHTPETKERLRQSSLGNTNMVGKSPSLATREKLKALNESRMKTLIVTSPDGEEFTVTGIRQFCRDHGLNRSNLMHVAKGHKLSHKGWKARYAD